LLGNHAELTTRLRHGNTTAQEIDERERRLGGYLGFGLLDGSWHDVN
jgi:hypothetical protein